MILSNVAMHFIACNKSLITNIKWNTKKTLLKNNRGLPQNRKLCLPACDRFYWWGVIWQTVEIMPKTLKKKL